MFDSRMSHAELLEAAGKQNERLVSALIEIERLRAIPKVLRERHFAAAHTDMVGDEERREGYIEALRDMERALEQGVSDK
jgi:hypothetical protein